MVKRNYLLGNGAIQHGHRYGIVSIHHGHLDTNFFCTRCQGVQAGGMTLVVQMMVATLVEDPILNEYIKRGIPG